MTKFITLNLLLHAKNLEVFFPLFRFGFILEKWLGFWRKVGYWLTWNMVGNETSDGIGTSKKSSNAYGSFMES